MTAPFAVKTWADVVEDNSTVQKQMGGVVVDFLIHHGIIQAIVVLDDGKVVSRKLNELRDADNAGME